MRWFSLLLALTVYAQAPGFLSRRGAPLFPIGFYQLPAGEEELRAMAAAGVNLVHCNTRADLDRVAAAGMQGWISLPLQLGDDPQGRLRAAVEAVRDHPALAVLEGPDEFVWNFTAASQLYRSGVYPHPDEWWLQTPLALEHARSEAARLMPSLLAGAAQVRRLDGGRHPLWINEAAPSDMPLVRQYIDAVDITGCDIYPVHGKDREDLAVIGDSTRRFHSIGRGRPVWMVLQGFSWSLLPDRHGNPLALPSFYQTRMMAYDAIASGARGILYWGTYLLRPEDAAFRQSLYAMTGELAALQPFLTAPEQNGVRVILTESDGRARPDDRGVRCMCRRAGSDWLVALVNEDDRPHAGVEIAGLPLDAGTRLDLLYGDEVAPIAHGGFVTRLKPYEVKVFASSRRWQSALTQGRGFHATEEVRSPGSQRPRTAE